ncbi:MAG: FAD-dependent oxidoreductase [Colwellia sp.]|nr:FAD-dependent oxidoreductase [Colwellia sp.]
MKTIAIIGAGLMGRLIALSLHRQGYQVTLFDKDTKAAHQSAAYAAAGLLTPLGEAMHCEPNIVEMGFISLKLWPKFLATLDEYTYFQQQGAIMVSHEQDQGDYRRLARYLQNHYPQHQCQQLDRQKLVDLEPEIGRSFSQGLFLPDEGQIGNRTLLIALKHQLEQAAIEWLSDCFICDISPINHGCMVSFQHIETTKQQRTFDLAIDCRGTGARTNANTDKNANKNSALKDLRAVRGELFQLFAPDVHITRPVRLMHPRYQLYIAPKTKGFYVVGATEIESDDDSPMTVRSAMELLSAAYSVHPGFAEANIRQHVSQCRPAFSDNQPKIIVNQHLIQVNGLYRHGFLIAPVVLEQVMQLVKNIQAGTSDYNESLYSHLLPINKKS